MSDNDESGAGVLRRIRAERREFQETVHAETRPLWVSLRSLRERRSRAHAPRRLASVGQRGGPARSPRHRAIPVVIDNDHRFSLAQAAPLRRR